MKITKKGRKPKSLKAQTAPIRVDLRAAMQPQDAWQNINIRDTTKSVLKVESLHRRVWLWNGKESQGLLWHLIARKDPGTNEIKYSVSNAPKQTSVQRLAYVQGQRCFIERVFQDAKGH